MVEQMCNFGKIPALQRKRSTKVTHYVTTRLENFFGIIRQQVGNRSKWGCSKARNNYRQAVWFSGKRFVISELEHGATKTNVALFYQNVTLLFDLIHFQFFRFSENTHQTKSELSQAAANGEPKQ